MAPNFEKLSKSTLLLGIGGQRCGTTWLGHHFKSHPDILMSPIKEMRFFVDTDGPVKWHIENFKKRQSRIQIKDAASRAWHAAYDERIAMGISSQNSVDGYKKFFQDRIQDQKYFCEITPSYMTLPVNDLAQIKTAFDDVKIVFLMRDPIARLWSMVRFNQKKQSQTDLNTFALTCLDIPNYVKRSDYKTALENIDAVFDPDQVFVGFYEDMFDGDLLSRLYDFLDLSPIDAVLDQHKNVSESARMSEDVAQYFATNLAEQYQYVRNRFGDQVPEGWIL